MTLLSDVSEWVLSKIAIPEEVSAVSCSVTAAHPWLYGLGQKTDNGSYLSPENAVGYLATKLASLGDEAEAVILLITGDSQEDFNTQLGAVADVIPTAELTQIKRLSESAAALAVEKMQIPAPLVSGVTSSAPFSVASARAAMNAQLISNAQQEAASGLSLDGAREAISAFQAVRDKALSDVASELENVRGKSAPAWVLSASGSVVKTVAAMLKGIPDAKAVYSAAFMFTGEDLKGIRGMIHEYESNAGA